MTLLSDLYTGGGNVTAAANLTDEGVIVGSGGAKGVKSLAVGGALALPRVNTGGTALEFGTGGQIAFPATAVPSADANTLDDYEEGTWTATFVCGTSGTITANASYDLMNYTKIGRQVTITGCVAVSSVSSPVGSVKIAGLPFANSAGTELSYRLAIPIACDAMENTATPAMQGKLYNNTSDIYIERFAAGVAVSAAADFKADTEIWINGSYFI